MRTLPKFIVLSCLIFFTGTCINAILEREALAAKVSRLSENLRETAPMFDKENEAEASSERGFIEAQNRELQMNLDELKSIHRMIIRGEYKAAKSRIIRLSQRQISWNQNFYSSDLFQELGPALEELHEHSVEQWFERINELIEEARQLCTEAEESSELYPIYHTGQRMSGQPTGRAE